MEKLNISELETVELSVDPVGKIFFYKNRVLRAINKEYIEQVNDMFNSGFMEEIISENLFPKTWISDISVDGFALIIEHDKIFYWNYPYEWSFDMLKDAGLLIIRLNIIANKYGYELLDAHTSNVVFNMNRPQYIDFGSFGKYDNIEKTPWKSYKIFYNHYYIPLYLWSKGYFNTASNIFLMRSYFSEKEFFKLKYPLINFFDDKYIFGFIDKIRTISLVSKAKINEKLGNSVKQKVALLIHDTFKKYFSIKRLEEKIINIKKPSELSMWSKYHDNIDIKNDKRFIRITEIIQTLKDATTLIELASNQGLFALHILENTNIKKVIATDYDNEAVNTMYNNNKNRDNFLTLLVDMVRITGRKYDEHLYNRIKCDIVVALAVTHHLILSQNISLDYIFKQMTKFTNKYIIVEFMPLGLYNGDLDKTPKLPLFYNLSWFKKNFIQYFDLISEEHIDTNRYLFIGKLR